MKKNKRNVFNVLFSRIFNKSNFNKFLIIFILGFVSRVFLGHFYNNVYLDLLNLVSASYYVCISAFIILVHNFVYYFDFNIIPFKFEILKESIKRFYINGLNNKLFMNSNVNEMKPYGEIGLSHKGSYSTRPVKSSPLSNPPITPANINEMKPTREIKFRNKSSNSLIPVNFSPNRSTTFQRASPFQVKDKYITKLKGEFKEFYTSYRESIKLSNYELESLSIKMAIEIAKGKDG
jgi:hypothetical protein